MSRGYTLDTRPVPSASKRVFDRGGRHRRNWRQNAYYLRFRQNEITVSPFPHFFTTQGSESSSMGTELRSAEGTDYWYYAKSAPLSGVFFYA